MNDYNHKEIEKKWQEYWREKGLHKVESKEGDNSYVLVEFPYPSGNLHVGHWYAFAVTDIYARYLKKTGKNVLFPIGFDAFGLPAENAAIKRGLNPKDWTYSNMEFMTKQLESMGTIFDWDRKVETCDPNYYKWTQWLFLQFYKKGIVNHEKSHVNWCPSCKTTLANEQLESGKCERCGSEVEQKEMMQWNIKITDYADRLIDDLDNLDWPNHIKESQKNWIGRSRGAYFDFDIKDSSEKIRVFTTRPDTLYGVTYVVVAPEHDLVQRIKDSVSNWSEVSEYIEKTNRKTDLERQTLKEKTGVMLEGVIAIHPATGKEVPVFISDYVLAQYGTGCVMAVPAHDQRDFEFAQKFNLPIKHVIRPIRVDRSNPPVEGKKNVPRRTIHALIRDSKTGNYLTLDWKKQPWSTFVVGGVDDGEDIIEAAKREVFEETGYGNLKLIGILGEAVEAHYFAAHKDENRIAYTNAIVFELDDIEDKAEISKEEDAKHSINWRSWDSIKKGPFTCGELDIWIDRIENGIGAMLESGTVINSGEFDGLNSDEVKSKITEKYGTVATTYKLQDWSVSRQRYWGCPIPMINCKKCGSIPVPESDLPVVLPEMNKIEMRDDGKSPLAHNDEWVNVSCPSCGGSAQRETDTLDTFVDSSWYYLRYLDPKNNEVFAEDSKIKEWMPIDFYSGGSEHTTRHLLYARFFYKVMFDLGLVPQSEPFAMRNNRGLILGPDGEKMSKSKGNVIEPDPLVETVGADTVRMYLAFIGPYNEAGSYPWDPNGVVGIRRFLERVWRLKSKAVTEEYPEAASMLHKTIRQVTQDTARLKFNTAISSLMILVNFLEKNTCPQDVYENLLIMLSAFAPHIADELWQRIGHGESIHLEKWPEFREEMIQEDSVTLAIQINGKLRHTMKLSKDIAEDDLQNSILDAPEVKKWIGNYSIKKFIYIPGKIVNIVV